MTGYQEDTLGLPTIRSDETCSPPEWALLQRSLLDEMQRACVEFVDRYTLPDGTLQWW
ncbi:MAG TPA: hypothetical protein VHZ51_05395 [Ktedonobacteraceae bacterium]|nr:hypothetical protein [Ktedonobacteraceae bacterium]